MIAALIIIGAWQTLNLLALLAGARLGVITLRLARPTKPKTTKEGDRT